MAWKDSLLGDLPSLLFSHVFMTLFRPWNLGPFFLVKSFDLILRQGPAWTHIIPQQLDPFHSGCMIFGMNTVPRTTFQSFLTLTSQWPRHRCLQRFLRNKVGIVLLPLLFSSSFIIYRSTDLFLSLSGVSGSLVFCKCSQELQEAIVGFIWSKRFLMVIVFETLESCTTHLRGNKRDSSIQQLYMICEADMYVCINVLDIITCV